MADRTNPIPPYLRVATESNEALTTWSTSQRTVIGLAADFAESDEWHRVRGALDCSGDRHRGEHHAGGIWVGKRCNACW